MIAMQVVNFHKAARERRLAANRGWAANRGNKGDLLPLWLSREEAEALLTLCAASPADVGRFERRLFGRLGDLLRAFGR